MADNLEDLNRQLEEAQRKAVDADKQYSSIREELSKIGENYYKTTMLTIKEQENVTKKYKELHQTLNKEIERRNVLNKALDEETKVEKQKVEKSKQEVTEIQKKIEEAKKPRGINAFLDRIGYKEPTGDDLALQRRAISRIEGISNFISGNYGAAFRDLTSSVPKLANLVRTGWFAALQLGVQALIKFDSALAKTTTSAISLTGGLNSSLVTKDYFSRGGSSLNFISNIKDPLYRIGMQNQFENLSNALTKNYGIASYNGQEKNFIETMAYSQKGLSSFGISPETANKLTRDLRLLEGKNQIGVYAQLQRLTDRFQSMSLMSPEQAIQQTLSLKDQTKNLGTNFEWASSTIKKFEKALELGTMSLSDFAAVNRAFQSGGVSKNAGISALLSDFASRSGINLPQSFLSSNAIGQGFALSTPEMLGKNSFARALSGQINQMLDEMGLSTTYERAGGLQMILGQYGINISSQAALESLTKSGQVDLIKSGVAGTKSFETSLEEDNKAKLFKEQTEAYYTASTSWHTNMYNAVDQIKNKMLGGVGRGMEGQNLDTDNFNVAEFTGVFLKSLFTKEYWKQYSSIAEGTLIGSAGPAMLYNLLDFNNGKK